MKAVHRDGNFNAIIVIYQQAKRDNLGVKKESSQGWYYYCDKCGFLATRRKKLRSHMEAVHRDGDFNATIVIYQQHKRSNLGVIKKSSQGLYYYCDKCSFPGSNEEET